MLARLRSPVGNREWIEKIRIQREWMLIEWRLIDANTG